MKFNIFDSIKRINNNENEPEKNQEDNTKNPEVLFEEYKKEILDVFEIFRSQNKEINSDDEEKFNELFNEAQNIIHTSGKSIIHPGEIAKEAKEILILRLKSLVQEFENANRYDKIKKNIDGHDPRTRYKINPTHEDIINAKLGLIYFGELEKGAEFTKFVRYLEDGIQEPFVSEHAFGLIVEKNKGYYRLSYDINRGGIGYLEGISNKSLVALLNEGTSYNGEVAMFEKGSSYQKYNREVFDALSRYGDCRIILKYWDKFEGIKIEDIIDVYCKRKDDDAAKGIINKLLDNDLISGDDKQKAFMRVASIYTIHSPYLIKEMSKHVPNFKENAEGFSVNEKVGGTEERINLSAEAAKIIKEKIEKGYIQYVDHRVLSEFLKENYDFVLKEVKKFKQEILILEFLKPKDQTIYIKELIEKNSKFMLDEVLDVKENMEKLKDGILDNNDFNVFKKNYHISIYEHNIRLFTGIDEENFLLIKESANKRDMSKDLDKFLFENIKRFDFQGGQYEKEKKYKEFISFIDDCYNNNANKYLQYFESDFCFSNFDLEKQDEQEQYIKEKADFLKKINQKLYPYFFSSNENPDWTEVGEAILKNDTHYKNGDIRNCLGQEEYDLLKKYGIYCNNDIKLSFFYNLNEDTLKEFTGGNITWSKINRIISRFELKDGSIYLKLIDEAKNVTENNSIREYYFNNFFNETDLKRKEIIDLIKEAQLINENDEFVIYYVDRFKKYETADESVLETKKDFIKNYKNGIDNLSKNKSLTETDKEMYKVICQEVYPKRNYNTYNNIDLYTDRSEDLASYSFNKEGYDIRLSGVVGYKIKDGIEKNPDLLQKYQNRIREIERLAKDKENIINFINKNFPDTKSKTIEGKIIEYVRENCNNSLAIDILLAYQLYGHYDNFIAESTDRTNMYEKMEGKEYVMLSELSERYGDLMKETLKDIAKKVSESEDKELFVKDISSETAKAKKLSIKIFNELSIIPENNLTTEVIQKKIVKSIINTFQQIPKIKDIAQKFVSSFNRDNFVSFLEIFTNKISDIFQEINTEIAIDIQQLETLRQKTYEEIKGELDKYEEIKEVDEERKGEVKMSKERIIKGYFSKNRENAHARMVGDICIALKPEMLENKNYFEFVLFDEERKKCVGTCMLLNMEEPEGRKYLLYCPNPSVDLVSQVSAERLYKLITKEISIFAEKNSFDGVLLNKSHGHATNRSGLFQTTLEKSVLRNNNGNEIIFNLNKKHVLADTYIYQDDLRAVWLKN